MARSVDNEEIPDHWLCPVCLEIPEKEVYQCRDGHILCKVCYFQVPEAKCPQCRDTLDRARPTRNRMMEEVLESFRVNCKFKSNGCDERLSKWSAAKHETECSFNIDKFGKIVNLCKAIGYPNCNFEVNFRNTKEAVEHFVFKHGCILTTSPTFSMELISFKDSAKDGGNGFHFWTPIIAELKEKKCYLMTMAILNKNEASFDVLSILLPSGSDYEAFPVQVEFTLDSGDRFKIWIEQSMTLKEASEVLPNQMCFANYSPAFVTDCSVDGSLLIKCNIKRDLVTVLSEQENVESFVCTKNSSDSVPDAVVDATAPSAVVEAPSAVGGAPTPSPVVQAPEPLVRFDREGGSLSAKVFRLKIEKGRWKKRNSYLPALKSLYGPTEFSQREVEWLKTDFIFTTARYGSVEAVKYLIEKKVNFNIATEMGEWPLHLALEDEDKNLGLAKAKLMVDRGGADVRVLNGYGWSALHLSARFFSNRAVKYFLLKGCDVNGATALGDTPLHLVCWNQTLEEERENIAETLLANGADPRVRNNSRRTPLEMAKRFRRDEIERLLQQSGGVDCDDGLKELENCFTFLSV